MVPLGTRIDTARSRRGSAWVLAGIGAAILPLSFACDTNPTGQIRPSPVHVKVGDTANVELFVRPKFDGLAHEVWKVEPDSLGEVYFDRATAVRRQATFRGKTPGTGKIVVDGFFGPPPVHRVAEVLVTVE
jgi:hypothetical protein